MDTTSTSEDDEEAYLENVGPAKASRVLFLPKTMKEKDTEEDQRWRRSVLGILLSLVCGMIFSVAGMIIKQFSLRFAELLLVRSLMQVEPFVRKIQTG